MDLSDRYMHAANATQHMYSVYTSDGCLINELSGPGMSVCICCTMLLVFDSD
jgi:hypothetical protein